MSQLFNNIEKNLKKLAELKMTNPSATHIYIRRVDKDNLIVDIPIEQAEFTIRNKPKWEVVSSNKQMADEVEKLFEDDKPSTAEELFTPELDVFVPPKPSEEVKKPKAKKKTAKAKKRRVK